MKKIFLLAFLPAALKAAYFGNPGLSALQTEGVIQSPTWYCVRAGAFADYVYRQRYNEEFQIDGDKTPSSYAKFWTTAGTLTIDIKNCFDIEGIVGSTKMQLDHEVYSKHQLSWGVGTKFLIYHTNSIYVGLDFKYFASNQKPTYFQSSGYAFNILSNYKMDYMELQGALGAAYRTQFLSPYLLVSYLYSKLSPNPTMALVRMPMYDGMTVSHSTSVVDKRRWGMAFGTTLIGGKKGSITIESRFFNQNALNISGEIRF